MTNLSPAENTPYDALLLVSFGGPEGHDDVMPFLENVLRGKNVPRERMSQVAEHYHHFGGKSPINQQNRSLIEALRTELDAASLSLRIYFGNRNWHPFLTDAIRTMRDDGVARALAFFTSPYSSYSGCRQYRENIAAAQIEVGPSAPSVEKLRAFFNHPGFLEGVADRVTAALVAIDSIEREHACILFTAHSIPIAMAQGSNYARQLCEASRLVADYVGISRWELVYQSRSGPPTQKWLEPDIGDRLRTLALESDRPSHVFIVPIGFISDHMEVVYDLDTEAYAICQELALPMTRVPTVGTHPRFVRMIRELIEERISAVRADLRPALGTLGPCPDVCPVDCCTFKQPSEMAR